MSNLKKFTCAHCKQEFQSNTNEKDKIEEAQRIFGEDPIENDYATVCGDCFRAMAEHFNWKIK